MGVARRAPGTRAARRPSTESRERSSTTTAFGLTLGYQINDNLGLTFSYKSTVSDNAPGDLQMDGFMISLVSGWHPLIEGSKRLKSE